MLLCGSCNRAKSWSCERCPNWLRAKKLSVCDSCYWAKPEDYSHAATLQIRRLDLVWAGDEVADYDRLRALAAKAKAPVPQFVRDVLKAAIRR